MPSKAMDETLNAGRRIGLRHTRAQLLADCRFCARDRGWSDLRRATEVARRVEARLGDLQRRVDEASRE